MIGCTTWACSPSTRSTSGERVSRSTSATWSALGRWLYSSPPCRCDDHDVGAGPARGDGPGRAGSRASHIETDHSRPVGQREAVECRRCRPRRRPAPRPRSSRITGRRRSAAVRNVPTCGTPARSSRSAVRTQAVVPLVEAVVGRRRAGVEPERRRSRWRSRAGPRRPGSSAAAGPVPRTAPPRGTAPRPPCSRAAAAPRTSGRSRSRFPCPVCAWSAAALCQTVLCQSRSPPITSVAVRRGAVARAAAGGRGWTRRRGAVAAPSRIWPIGEGGRGGRVGVRRAERRGERRAGRRPTPEPPPVPHPHADSDAHPRLPVAKNRLRG